MTNEELKAFLQKAADVLPTHTETDNFCSFDLFRIDEMTISRTLSFLIDPSAPHGQSSLFLDALVSHLNQVHSINDEKHINLKFDDFVKVHTEYPTTSGRFDIFIEGKDYGLVIENKSNGAKDGDCQIQNYATWLAEKYKERGLVVYLSEKYPSSYTLGDSELTAKRTVQLTLRKLCEILENVSITPECEKLKFFVQDFIKYIRVHLCGIDMNNSWLLNLIKNDYQQLRAVFEIHNNFHEMLVCSQNQFSKTIQKQLKEHFEETVTAEYFSRNGYGGIQFQFKNAKHRDSWALTIESKYSNLTDVFWGISWLGNDEVIKSKLSLMFEECLGKGWTDHSNWIWWNWADFSHNKTRNWATPDMVKMMLDDNDNKLSQYVIEMIEKVVKYIDEGKL